MYPKNSGLTDNNLHLCKLRPLMRVCESHLANEDDMQCICLYVETLSENSKDGFSTC